MFRIEIKAKRASGNGAFLGAHGIPTSGVHWCLSSQPEFPIPHPIYEANYSELLTLAKRVCRKRGGWIFVIDENDETLVAQEWKEGGEIEPELSGHYFLFPHDPKEFRF